MAKDFFLKLDGIDGQSNDKSHGKWIEVIGFSHGSMQNVSMARGVDVAGRGQFIPFVFSHQVDKATPKLQQFCMNGKNIPKATFQVCRAIAGLQVATYEVSMENVKIAKAEIRTPEMKDNQEGNEPVEFVELVAGKMTWKVTPIKPDNTKEGAIEASFDQIANA